MRCNMTFPCHVMTLALGLESWNAIALVSVSCNVDSTINAATAFLRSRWLSARKLLNQSSEIWSKTFTITQNLTLCMPKHHVILTVLSMVPLYLTGQDNQIRCKYDFHIIWCHWHWHYCDIINGTFEFHMHRRLKIRCNMTFLSCNATGIDSSVVWCQRCHLWHHCIP